MATATPTWFLLPPLGSDGAELWFPPWWPLELNDMTQNCERVKNYEGKFNPGRQKWIGWLMTSLPFLETPHPDGLFRDAMVHVASSEISSDFEISSLWGRCWPALALLRICLPTFLFHFPSPHPCFPGIAISPFLPKKTCRRLCFLENLG